MMGKHSLFTEVSAQVHYPSVVVSFIGLRSHFVKENNE